MPALTAGTLLVLSVALAEDSCAAAPLLPAYSHNDYYNPSPLFDALDRGFRGVEADLFRREGELLVGHDPGQLRPGRTLERLYLAPLAERVDRCGWVLPSPEPFLLNLELKERDLEGFATLLRKLQAYDQLFRSVHRPAPIRVTLVGWWPAPEDLDVTWPDYLRVQLALEHAAGGPVRAGPSVGLVSIDHSESLRWRGRGTVPDRALRILARGVELATRFDVPLRVHQAPVQREVYRWLLDSGVDLIGVKDLRAGGDLLRAMRQDWQPPPAPR